MSNRFQRGSPILIAGNTTPGDQLTKQEKECFGTILKACRDYGCDFYPTIINKLTYDEMYEIAAYGGFPRRYPHWSWGMEYGQMSKEYEYGLMRIYEMVINTNPCHIYILNSNTLMDNIMVVAHATFHNDFFKNNIYFQPTAVSDPHAENMMNKLANHGSRIQKYMNRWGMERVTEFIDNVQRIHTLIDLTKIWEQKQIKDVVIKDERKCEHPRLLEVRKDRLYMDPFINTREYIEAEKDRIQKREMEKEMELFRSEDKDIFGYLKDHAPLKPWQQDIISILYEEELYFGPQRMTKTLNEGFASFGDYEIMARQGYTGLGQKTHDCGIVDYAKHKMGVLGGKYSMNPYKIGFYLLLDIEERWNKGQFGPEWDKCNNWQERETWDLKLGLGKQKVFEVRKNYDDLTFILEYFTQDFCDKFEFYEWKKYPSGEVKIENRDHKKIKKKLLHQYVNAGLPDIRLVDPNHKGKGWLLLEHKFDGRDLYEPYARATMNSLYYLWQREIVLITKNQNWEEEVYICGGSDPEKDVAKVSRDDYDRRW